MKINTSHQLLKWIILSLVLIALPSYAAIRDSSKSIADELSSYSSITPKVQINNRLIDPSGQVRVAKPDLNINVSSHAETYQALLLVGPINAALATLPTSESSRQSSKQYQLAGLVDSLGTGKISGFVLQSTLPFQLSPSPKTISQHRNAATDLFKILKESNNDFQVGSFSFFLDESQSDLQISQTRMMQELSNRADEITNEATTAIESTPLVANDIQFATNSAQLNERGTRQLDVLGLSLQEFRQKGQIFRITLEGHTDDTGSADYNQTLSEERAESARLYLLNQYQLPSSSIVSRGRGEYMPIMPSTSREARARNRRVEILVTK